MNIEVQQCVLQCVMACSLFAVVASAALYARAARKLARGPDRSLKDAKARDAEIVRVMIRHENDLTNHRLTWMLTLEGFLFAGIGFAWDKRPTPELVFIFAILGTATAGTAVIVLDAAHSAILSLATWWDKHKPNDSYADVLGFRGHHWVLGIFAPWRIVPLALVVTWYLLFLAKAERGCFRQIGAP